MEENYCSQLENLPKDKKDIYRFDSFLCKLTGRRCMAASYERRNSEHRMACVAKYNDLYAEANCPTYNLSEELAKQIREFRSEAKKSRLEKNL